MLACQHVADMIQHVAEASLAMLSSEPGCKAVCHAIGMATAKLRKVVVKALRGNVVEAAMHDVGHMALIRLLDATDDTVRAELLAALWCDATTVCDDVQRVCRNCPSR